MALVKPVSAMPARSTITTEVRPSRVAMSWRMAVASRPPRNAASGRPRPASAPRAPPSAEAPSTIHSAAASAAPDETPTMPGSASGLRNRPCITAPATAVAAPTRIASTVRGSRTSRTMTASRAASA